MQWEKSILKCILVTEIMQFFYAKKWKLNKIIIWLVIENKFPEVITLFEVSWLTLSTLK